MPRAKFEESDEDEADEVVTPQRRHATRAIKPKVADSKLARLRQARQEGVKHKVSESAGDDLFEYVSEADYQRMVAKRQADAFVVDDDEGLYDDHGGEIWDNEVQLKDDDEREQQRILDEQNKKHLEKQRAQKKLEKEMEFVPPALRSHAETLAMAASLTSSSKSSAGNVDIRDMFKAMKQQQGSSSGTGAASSTLSNAADAALQEALQSVDSFVAENDAMEYIPLTARPQPFDGTSNYRSMPFGGGMRMSTAPPSSRLVQEQPSSLASETVDLRSSMMQRKRDKKAQRDAEPRFALPLNSESLKAAQSCPNVAQETPKRRLVFEDEVDTTQRKKSNAGDVKPPTLTNVKSILSPLTTHTVTAAPLSGTRAEIAEFACDDDDGFAVGVTDDDFADSSASVKFDERSFHSPTLEENASDVAAKPHDPPTTPHRPHRHASGPGGEHQLCLDSPTYNQLHPSNGSVLTASPTFEYAAHGGAGRLASAEKQYAALQHAANADSEDSNVEGMDLSGLFDDVEKAESNTMPVLHNNLKAASTLTPTQVSANRAAAQAKRLASAGAASAVFNALESSSTEFKFYLLDIVEDTTWIGQGDAKYKSGRLFLFGKCYDPTERAYVSCCVVLKGMQRQLFFQLAAEVQESDACATIETLLRKHLPSNATHLYRCAVKNYAFFEHVDVPNSDKYMEVRYSFNHPPLGEEVLGNRKTFTHLFGATNPAFELFVVDRKIEGPSWLVVKNFFCVSSLNAGTAASKNASPALRSRFATGGAQMTWCKVEIHVDDAVNISPMPNGQEFPTPPLSMMVIQLRTLDTEIVAAAMLVKHKFNIDSTFDAQNRLYDDYECLIAKPKAGVFPIGHETALAAERAEAKNDLDKGLKAFAYANEQQLLNNLMDRYIFWDPDLLVVHDGVDFQLSTLLQRLLVHNNSQWSRLGRLRLTRRPAKTPKQQQARFDLLDTTRGRLICDLKLSAKEIVHCKSYDLANLVHEVLSDQRAVGPLQESMALAYKTTDDLSQSLYWLVADAYWTIRLTVELQALSLAKEITQIAGNTLSKTLLRGRAERNEYLLLHKFALANYIYPDKPERHYQNALADASKTNTGKKTGKKSGRKPVVNKTPLIKKVEIDDDEKKSVADFVFDDSAFDELFGGSDADMSISTANAPVPNEPIDAEAVELDAEHDEENIDPNGAVVANNQQGGRRKPAYAGGLVLDPKPGFYDTYILLMDFNSLYPSVIQEYNICFSTVDRSAPCFAKTNVDDDSDGIAPLPVPGQPPGVLPNVIKTLVERRREVKKLLKDEKISVDKRARLEILQKALKLTANSMYGCLGFAGSRFCAKPLAALITQKGREALMSTKSIVDKMHLDVIYGDTDSLMINTHSTDFLAARKLGFGIKAEVNKQYKCMELDVDGLYRTMLLLKKKKYAALQAEMVKATGGGADGGEPEMKFKEELKGLDIVRRDWCELSRRVGRQIVGMLLKPDTKREDVVMDIHKVLEEVASDVNAGLVQLDQYIINKQLTKDPKEYGGSGGDENAARGLAHVQVALRYNKTIAGGNNLLKRGDTVPYVVCTVDADGRGPEGVPHTQRAWHVAEVRRLKGLALSKQNREAKKADNLDDAAGKSAEVNHTDFLVPEIDKNYYLAHQLHPVISRLVEPIDGTSAASIGQFLGLDAALVRSLARQNHAVEGGDADDDAALLGVVSDAERFALCKPFNLRCGKCANTSAALTFTSATPFSTPNLSANSIEADLSLEQGCPLEVGAKRCGWRALPDNLSYVVLELEKAMDFYVRMRKVKTYVCTSLACGSKINQDGRTGRFTLRCRECGRDSLREEYSEADLYKQLLFFRKMFALREVHANLERNKPNSALVAALQYKKQREPLLWDQYDVLVKCVDEKLRKVQYANVSFDVFFPNTAKVKIEEEEEDDFDADDEPMDISTSMQTPARKMPSGLGSASLYGSGGSFSLADVSVIPETPRQYNGGSHNTSISSPMGSQLSHVTHSTTKKFNALSMLASTINNNDGGGIGEGIRSNRFGDFDD